MIGGGVAVVLIALAAAGIWWYLRDDAPEKASTETATRSLEQSSSTTEPTEGTEGTEAPSTTGATGTSEPATTEAVADGIEGTWVVDTSLAEFDFDQTLGNFVGFRVDEELSGIGAATAVGRTPGVSGSITIEGTTLTAVEVEADMTQLVTDNSRRDPRAREALGVDEFPTATFVLTEPVELGDDPASGVSVTAVGELTIHGVTQPFEIPIEAELVDDVVVVTGNADVVFADFGVETPTAALVLSVEDHGPIEIQLLLSRG